MSVADLAQAVTRAGCGRLVKVPGIGKKTAERLLLELKGKIGADLGAPRQRWPATRRPTSCRRWWRWATATRRPPAALKALPQGRRRERRHQAGAEGAAEPTRHDASKTDDFDMPPPPKRVVSAAPASPQRRGDRARAAAQAAARIRRARPRRASSWRSSSAPPRKRGEALDHVLLFGPPGLGKTTLSHIIAHELGVNLRQTSGPVLEKPKDLAALLTNLEKNDVLFIDEIHRLSPVVEEILYPALEDYQIDIMIGEGPAARSIKLDLQPFTLVGATTRAGMLTNPLRDRFGIVARLEFYTPEELARIVHAQRRPAEGADRRRRARRRSRAARAARRASPTGCCAACATTPTSRATGRITQDIADEGAGHAGRRPAGLRRDGPQAAGGGDPPLRRRPGGAGQHRRRIGEERDTIEDVIEPYLIQQGYLQRTPRGRIATLAAYRHLGVAPPETSGRPVRTLVGCRTGGHGMASQRTTFAQPAHTPQAGDNQRRAAEQGGQRPRVCEPQQHAHAAQQHDEQQSAPAPARRATWPGRSAALPRCGTPASESARRRRPAASPAA